MSTYKVTVKYKSGWVSEFPNVLAWNKRDAKNLVIAELWDLGYSKQDVKSIKVEFIL